jgi:hypothetical protein
MTPSIAEVISHLSFTHDLLNIKLDLDLFVEGGVREYKRGGLPALFLYVDAQSEEVRA